MRHYLLYCVIMLCFTTTISFGGFAARMRRSVREKKTTRVTCSSAFERCDANEFCSTALSKLETLCKVTANRCNAKMKDLPRCGQIMDHLFAFGLPEEGCKCSNGNPDCIRRQKKIYDNGCFGAIRHLREHQLFPKKLDAYDQVTKFETTTTATWQAVSETHRSALLDGNVERLSTATTKMSYVNEEPATSPIVPTMAASVLTQIVEVDSLTKKRPIPRATSASANLRFDQPLEDANAAKVEDTESKKIMIVPIARVASSTKKRKDNVIQAEISPHDANAQRVVEGHSKSPLTMSSRRHDRLKMNAAQRKVSAEFDTPEKLDKSHNNTDYKTIAIILGILLAIVVLSSLIVFLWTRTSNLVLHAGSKFVKDRRMDDEVYSTIRFLSPSSSES